MLKKLALVVLFGISNLQAAETPKIGFIQRVKHSRAIIKIAAIIPCIAACISMESIRRTHKDNPEKSTLVKVASGIECISIFIVAIFSRWLLDVDFLKLVVSQPKNDV
jgi:hypothetical protein